MADSGKRCIVLIFVLMDGSAAGAGPPPFVKLKTGFATYIQGTGGEASDGSEDGKFMKFHRNPMQCKNNKFTGIHGIPNNYQYNTKTMGQRPVADHPPR